MEFRPISQCTEFGIQDKDDFDNSILYGLDDGFKVDWTRLRLWLEDDEVLNEVYLFVEQNGILADDIGNDVALYQIDEMSVALIQIDGMMGIIINVNDVENFKSII